MPQTKYIFVTGGVMSSLGKGLAAASLAALLQARGFRICIRKLELYLNVDPGTLSPYQHGEVFVTEDGTEADLDLGHYERFTGRNAEKADFFTTGKIYAEIIERERRGDYLGGTVQVIPHVTDIIKKFITSHADHFDFVLHEIGGTVGDIEGAPFLEALRQLQNDFGKHRTFFVHLTYLPYVKTAGELKTKPTQHSVKTLLHAGIQPDLLLCRCEIPLSESVKNKLALFCNVPAEDVIAALDVNNIYRVPMNYSLERFDERVCSHFKLSTKEHTFSQEWLERWAELNDRIENAPHEVAVALVGKYTELPDAYKSIKEALVHAGAHNNVRVNILWCNSETSPDILAEIQGADAVLVPGGFGQRGTENKIKATQWVREQKVPFLGICLGMQLALIEVFRNIAHVEANSTEFDPETPNPVISLITEWKNNDGTLSKRHAKVDLGGTLRVGAYPCLLAEGSKAREAYQTDHISERHRHRYEFNLPEFGETLKDLGLTISGTSPDGRLTEIIERTDHPWFVGVQFHPEFKSRPIEPHPLFASFIQAAFACKQRKKR
ncbi:CTP synthase [Alphaproteobacteria bacterium]|nr:CTP synthase [Alphaproteobacteria bacterium]GHS97033.1 CTP synthase [Alphaproteobacteria bacterium]